MKTPKKKLGIIGGMGPQATQMFYQRVLDATDANSDQEHIPALILSDTQIPDRTAAILSGKTAEVRAELLADARFLENWGASVLAIPCNTSHVFVPELQTELQDSFIVNMITETADVLRRLGVRRTGILATDGTIQMGLYQNACQAAGLEAVTPPPELQAVVMDIIYGEIKKGEKGSREKFALLDQFFRAQGCERVVLACTELSVYKDWHGLPDFYLDAMDVLARRTVAVCGYPLRNV